MRSRLCRIKLPGRNFPGLHLGTAFIQYHKALDPISQTENTAITVRKRPFGGGGAITLNIDPVGFRNYANPQADWLRGYADADASDKRNEAEQGDKFSIE